MNKFRIIDGEKYSYKKDKWVKENKGEILLSKLYGIPLKCPVCNKKIGDEIDDSIITAWRYNKSCVNCYVENEMKNMNNIGKDRYKLEKSKEELIDHYNSLLKVIEDVEKTDIPDDVRVITSGEGKISKFESGDVQNIKDKKLNYLVDKKNKIEQLIQNINKKLDECAN